jgi:sec-independent protein translocase protein TatA
VSSLTYVLMAGIPGGAELWIVLLIILILFGSRLPAIARSLGQGISEFKKGLNSPDAEAKGSGGKAESKDEPAAKA